MSFRNTFSGVKKDIKGLFRGKKRNKDKEGPGTIAEGADLEESPSRSESPFVGGGDRDLKGSGSNLVGGQFSSADRPEQRDKSEPVPAGGKTNQGDGEEGADQIELSQAQRPRPHSNVKAVVGGGHGEKAGQVPSDILISDSAKPDGMQTRLFLLRSLTLLANNADLTSVPDPTQKDPPLEVSIEPAAVTDEKRSDWKSTAFATAKLLLRGVRDTADAFGPLKSVAGGLCFVLENCEVFPVSYISCAVYDAYRFLSKPKQTAKQ